MKHMLGEKADLQRYVFILMQCSKVLNNVAYLLRNDQITSALSSCRKGSILATSCARA